MNGIINRLGTVLKDTDVDLSLNNVLGGAIGQDNGVPTAQMTFLPNKYYAIAFASRLGVASDYTLA